MEDTEKTMEERLLLSSKDGEYLLEKRSELRTRNSSSLDWETFTEEVKRVGIIAGPLVAVILTQYLLQVVSTMMVGHLGKLALSSTSIAISLSGVTGFSLLVSI